MSSRPNSDRHLIRRGGEMDRNEARLLSLSTFCQTTQQTHVCCATGEYFLFCTRHILLLLLLLLLLLVSINQKTNIQSDMLQGQMQDDRIKREFAAEAVWRRRKKAETKLDLVPTWLPILYSWMYQPLGLQQKKRERDDFDFLSIDKTAALSAI